MPEQYDSFFIRISKTEFKAHALEVLRDIEQSGQPRIITDRGRPTLEIRKLRQQEVDPLEMLKGTVVKYEAATAPVADDDWENA
jgi:antitoxin (DNA-binding transcriptional repressor) of toxin-antitoxin stability system